MGLVSYVWIVEIQVGAVNMQIKNIKINQEKEKVKVTSEFDFKELLDISYVLRDNEWNGRFENMTVKFENEDDVIPLKALILEAPDKMSEERLEKFLDFLFQWNYIHFPLDNGHIV